MPLIKTVVCLIVIGFACTISGCGGSVYAESKKPREVAPQASPQDIDALSAGNTEFAVDLYKKLCIGTDNVAFSPYSISLGMAMVYAGARGETEKQIASTFHFTLPQEKLAKTFNNVDLALTDLGNLHKVLELKVADSLWKQKGTQLLPEFLDTLAVNYGVGVHLVDFKNNPDKSVRQINEWVSKETEDKIADVVPPGAIQDSTGIVLVNAIYFKADWYEKFERKDTHNDEFHLIDGSTVKANLMDKTTGPGYAEGDGWQAASIPYLTLFDDKPASMIIILPEEARFNEIQDSLDESKITGIISSLRERLVHIILPVFKIESSFNLKEALTGLGMTEPFSQEADFSGMDGQKLLYIQDVLQKAYIYVDEEGTEAAAATAISMPFAAIAEPGEQPIEFIANHPFIFLIREKATGTILFMGRVMNPNQ
jgi:serpin B